MNTTCKCGKPVTSILYNKTTTYDRHGRNIPDEEGVCDYHANKARSLGYKVVLMVEFEVDY